MIKFFRKIRYNLLSDNKTGKYFKYAVGEIILVVIGILIALQINNWNENQKAHKAKKEEYAAIILDLDRDLERQMRLYWAVGWAKIATYDIAGKSLVDTTFVDIISFNYFNYLIYTLEYYSYVKENHKHLTGEINEEDINHKLANYLYYQNSVDQGLSAYNSLIEELRSYFSVNGILDLEAATSFDGAYTSNLNIQVVNEDKLRSQMHDESFQGHLVMLKTLSERLRQKMFGLMKTNYELQVLLANFIDQPIDNNLGVVGSAIPGGPDQFVALKQINDQENTWEIMLDLEDGKIKFQKDKYPWAYRWGRNLFQQGELEPLGSDIPVKKGRYQIQVNLNELTYSLTEKEE